MNTAPSPPGDGRRAVRFDCCFSAVFVTVRRRSGVYRTDSWQTRYLLGLGYSAVALLFGPWGVPWGPVWTARAVWTNLTGGVDAAAELSPGGSTGAGESVVIEPD